MGTLWRDFVMPKKLVCDEATLTDTYGKFIAEPFERGFGATIGNSLRRILISSIEGAAVTSVKIDGVLHEFTTVPGVLEDVTQIVLNVKQLVLRSHTRQPKTLVIERDKKGVVTAADIKADDTVEVINPDTLVCTMTKPGPFRMEMELSRGRGYVPAEHHRAEGEAIGVVPIDTMFSPVRRVNFSVEDTRVGQVTDYDRLILEIWTNGAMTPKDALLYSSNILQRHLDLFTGFGALPPEPEESVAPSVSEELLEKLRTPIAELELSVRSANCLREAQIRTIGDLVQKSPQELLKYRNFGKKSLAEIEELLGSMNVQLGMAVPEQAQSGESAPPA